MCRAANELRMMDLGWWLARRQWHGSEGIPGWSCFGIVALNEVIAIVITDILADVSILGTKCHCKIASEIFPATGVVLVGFPILECQGPGIVCPGNTPSLGQLHTGISNIMLVACQILPRCILRITSLITLVLSYSQS